MKHKNFDFRFLLDVPFLYSVFCDLVGRNSATKRFTRDFIKPFPKACILDIGCGPGSLLPFLPEGVEYIGYDMNPSYIKEAIKKYKHRGKFYCERVDEININNNAFDVVTSLGVLHHLNNGEAKKLFKAASSGLKPGGCLVTIDGTYTKDQSKIAKFIISKDRGEYVRKPEEYLELAKSSFSKIETTILDDMLRIPYTHFIMKCIKE